MNVLIAKINYSDHFKNECRLFFPDDQKLNHGVDTGQMEVGAYLKGRAVHKVTASELSRLIAKGKDKLDDYEFKLWTDVKEAAQAEDLLKLWRLEVKDILG